MEKIISYIFFVGTGVSITLQLLIGGLIIGLFLGTILSILRYKKIGVFIINIFISILRGTPLILQLGIVYFAMPGLIGFKLGVVAAGIFTFGLNASAYIAEILRSGIDSLPVGQFEAAKTLQIPDFYIWKDIILPQVIRNISPALINEVIAELKETALISTIGGADILRKAQMISAEQFTYFMPLCIAAGYYYGFVLLIEYFGKKIEFTGQYAKSK